MNNTLKQARHEIIKKALFPSFLLVCFIVSYVFYKTRISPLISLEIRVHYKKYIATLFIMCIIFLLQRIIGGIAFWYKEVIASKTQTRLDDELIPLVRRILKVGIWIVGLLVILPLYGINTSALVTTLGVSSLAIALAAQDTIANIIAGFLIMLDRPFRIGDTIKLPSGEKVTVFDIGVRRSKFVAEDKAIIIVPNVDLSKSKIVNYTYAQE